MLHIYSYSYIGCILIAIFIATNLQLAAIYHNMLQRSKKPDPHRCPVGITLEGQVPPLYCFVIQFYIV